MVILAFSEGYGINLVFACDARDDVLKSGQDHSNFFVDDQPNAPQVDRKPTASCCSGKKRR